MMTLINSIGKVVESLGGLWKLVEDGGTIEFHISDRP
jgi:hypothetical protein